MSNSSQSSIARKKPSKSSWRPMVAFSGTSQLEVLTVIANCGENTNAATKAIIKWLESKLARGKTEDEILAKLDAMEVKFLPFPSIHPSFHIARRATGLPQSLILLGGTRPSTPASSILSYPNVGPSAPPRAVPPIPPPPHFLVSNARNGRPSTSSGATVPRPLQLRPAHIPNVRVGRSQSMSSPVTPRAMAFPSEATTPTYKMETEMTPPEDPSDTEVLIDRSGARASIDTWGTRASTDTDRSYEGGTSFLPLSASVPVRRWNPPSIAFAPTPAGTSDASDTSSTASPVFSDRSVMSRPSTSASTYPSVRSSPSYTSFHAANEFRQSVAPKPDNEVIESLLSSASAETFLRLFRG